MNIIKSVEHPFEDVAIITIYEPELDAAATSTLYPVQIDDVSVDFFIDDNGVWRSTFPDTISTKVVLYIGDLIEQATR